MSINKTNFLILVVRSFTIFARNSIGVLQTPYESCRRLSKGNNLEQSIPIFLIVLSYFAWSALAHHGISAHPFLLTFSFGRLLTAAVVTYVLVIGSIVVVGKVFRSKGSVKSVFLPWTYSLLPTVAWFFATSLLWFLFPPPRTTSFTGQLLSFAFIVFSLFLLFWKGVLYYLTLRFGLRIGLWKIISVSIIIFPLGALYAIAMYRLGVFRIPFI